MLTPAYLDKLPSRVVQLYVGVEIRILEDMARRIAKMEQLTETAQWQAWRLEQIGAEREFIRYHLQRLTGKTQGELNALFQQAGEEALYFDDKIYRAAGLSPTALAQNKILQQIIAAGLRKTNQLFENLTSTTANTATRQFENALDDAYMDVVSGAFSYQDAVARAVKSLSRDGINAIQYPTGHVDHLDVAVRRAVLTGVNQTAAEVQLARMDEMGCDLVETTAHAGARPSHALWQGRVFSRSGRSRRYPDFVSSTGYGSGPGLCGWNCRHSFFPFFEGLSERAYSRQDLAQLKQQNVSYNGKQYTEYDASQLQRAMERQIRRWKREYLALDAAGQDTAQASARLAYWRGRQKDFSRQTGLRQDSFRNRVEGFGRSQAAKATAQAKRVVAKTVQSAILKDIQLEPLTITARSIQNVHRFSCEILSPQLQTRLQNEHKRLLMFVSGKPLGTEAAATYTLNVKQLNRVMGDDGQGKIRIPRENVPYIAAHTHPTGGTFTHTDLLLFARDGNMMMLTAVGNNGAVYAVGKKANFNHDKFLAYYQDTLDKFPKAKVLLESGMMNAPEQTQSDYINEYVKFMENLLKRSEEYGVQYYTSAP